jgi:hypothetical protein
MCQCFRLFTLALLAVIAVFGFWLGVYERTAIEGSMLWYAALAVVLLRERPRRRNLTAAGRR